MKKGHISERRPKHRIYSPAATTREAGNMISRPLESFKEDVMRYETALLIKETLQSMRAYALAGLALRIVAAIIITLIWKLA